MLLVGSSAWPPRRFRLRSSAPVADEELYVSSGVANTSDLINRRESNTPTGWPYPIPASSVSGSGLVGRCATSVVRKGIAPEPPTKGDCRVSAAVCATAGAG